ncbi:MAG: rod shape-determining protein RodA [Parcubacteria group bacterium]|nr:rod shape-determining protein RodA [Parcubacteria group bacterium]
MRISFRPVLRQFDWWLLGASLTLTTFGILLIWSLSWPEDNLFVRQIAFLGVGLVAAFSVQALDRHFWRNASAVFYGITVLLLLGLLFFGEATRGTRGWIYFGSFGFQVAEFAKIAVILFLATTLEKLNFDLGNLRHLILTAVVVGLPSGLILLQPDFGSAFIMVMVGAVMVLFTGLDRTRLVVVMSAAVLLAAGVWFGVLADYQKQRILSFANPGLDPLGAGYNVRQSIVAIGSGGLLGRGLGLGPQSQLNFLPEQETDFIFASLAEELGFVGSVALLAAYAVLFWRLYLAIRGGRDLFSNFLLLGIFTMFLAQAVINIGMNMGLLPVTGIPLPFVSYGGSSLLVSYFAIGLVQNVRR